MTFTLSPDRMPSAIATDPRVAAHTRIGATVSATVAWSIEHSASSSVSRATILDGKNHEGGVLAKPRSRELAHAGAFFPDVVATFLTGFSVGMQPLVFHISNSLYTRLESEHKDEPRSRAAASALRKHEAEAEADLSRTIIFPPLVSAARCRSAKPPSGLSAARPSCRSYRRRPRSATPCSSWMCRCSR